MTPLVRGLVELLHGQLERVGPRIGASSGDRALVRVFNSERTALFATRAFSFVRLRFFWLLMFATRFLTPAAYENGKS